MIYVTCTADFERSLLATSAPQLSWCSKVKLRFVNINVNNISQHIVYTYESYIYIKLKVVNIHVNNIYRNIEYSMNHI